MLDRIRVFMCLGVCVCVLKKYYYLVRLVNTFSTLISLHSYFLLNDLPNENRVLKIKALIHEIYSIFGQPDGKLSASLILSETSLHRNKVPELCRYYLIKICLRIFS